MLNEVPYKVNSARGNNTTGMNRLRALGVPSWSTASSTDGTRTSDFPNADGALPLLHRENGDSIYSAPCWALRLHVVTPADLVPVRPPDSLPIPTS